MIKILNLKLDHVRISKYKNILAKGYITVWPEEVFVIKKVKINLPWAYVIENICREKLARNFYEKALQKTS